MRVAVFALCLLVSAYLSLCAAVFSWTHEYQNLTSMRLVEISNFLGQPKNVDGVRQTVSFDGTDGEKLIEVKLIYSDTEMGDLQKLENLSNYGKPYFAYLSLIKDGKI